ncbi:MAG: ATP-grasp domain-containing protein [Chloroflexia bacterium]
MKTPDILLVTCAEVPRLSEDDRLLLSALSARGLFAWPAVWDNPEVDWAASCLCVVRSAWDYHHRRDEFVAWAERVGSVTRLWNPVQTIRWNTHKGYLRDLEARGVPIVPTEWLAAGTAADLAALMAARDWERAVVKPAVSASAFETIRVDRASLADGQEHLDRLLPERDMMVQPYMEAVEGYGERSLLFIGGEFTHAVRRASSLDTDEDPTPLATQVAPTPDEAALAGEILRAAATPALYARVDLIRDADGAPRLMELELVEPSLFLSHYPPAVERFADAIARLA